MKQLWSSIATAALVLASSGCGVLGSDYYVPTEDTLRLRTGAFIISDASGLKGAYGNGDVDSLIGSYEVPPTRSAEAVFRDIEDASSATGWRVARRQPYAREFHRFTPGQLDSFEVTRVRFDPTTRSVVIGWLQLDGPNTYDDASRSSSGRWATRELWPRFEAHLR